MLQMRDVIRLERLVSSPGAAILRFAVKLDCHECQGQVVISHLWKGRRADMSCTPPYCSACLAIELFREIIRDGFAKCDLLESDVEEEEDDDCGSED